jgi:hypothetical protein
MNLGKILLVAACLALSPSWASAEEWALYAGSRMDRPAKAALGDWYALNKLPSVPGPEATADHYIDEESIGGSLVAEAAIVRVWEKYVQGRNGTFERSGPGHRGRRIASGLKSASSDMPGSFRSSSTGRRSDALRDQLLARVHHPRGEHYDSKEPDGREAGQHGPWMPIIRALMETFAKACGAISSVTSLDLEAVTRT